MRDRGYQIAHGADREAIFEQAQMLIERDVMVQHANKVLQALDAEHEGLVFGRLDVTSTDEPPTGDVSTGDVSTGEWSDGGGVTADDLTADDLRMTSSRMTRCAPDGRCSTSDGSACVT